MIKKDLLNGQDYIVKSVKDCYGKNFIGEGKWLIISSLTEDEVIRRYSTQIEAYKPWIFLTLEQYKVIIDYQRNDMKYKKRERNLFSYNDVEIEDEDERIPVSLDQYFSYEGWTFFQNITGVSKLSKKQQERLFLIEYIGLTYDEVAEREGKPKSAIFESVAREKSKLRKIHGKLQSGGQLTEVADAEEDVQ